MRVPGSRMYYYCPTSFTKHPDLEVKSRVRITNIPADSSDPSVEVTDEWGTTAKVYNVFWEDLRR
jgi:hypothetical protein